MTTLEAITSPGSLITLRNIGIIVAILAVACGTYLFIEWIKEKRR